MIALLLSYVAYLGLFLTSITLIVRASRREAGPAIPRRASWRYRENLPLLVTNSGFGTAVALLVLMACREDHAFDFMLPGVLGILAALCLIPSIGRSRSHVIALNSMALIPVVLVPLAFVILLGRVR